MQLAYSSVHGIHGTVVLVRGEDEVQQDTLLRPLTETDGETITRQWSTLMRRKNGTRFGDSGWNWSSIVQKTVTARGWFGWVIQKGTLIQGAVTLRSPFRLINGDRGIFIERLATAPWNRPEDLVNAGVPANKLVGSWLMYSGIASSLCLGNKGRCALDAYREAEPFYIRLGLAAKSHRSFQRYYELDPTNNSVVQKWISNLLSL